jgi:hypothetical protein
VSQWAARARSQQRLALVATLCGAVLVVYLIRLIGMGHTEVVRSDYLSAQTGGVLVAEGGGSQLYVDAAQAPVYARLVGGDHTGDLLFNHAPLTAVMDAPISGLDPVSGHRLWSLFQFLLVTIGCGVVAMAAPWPKRTPRLLPVAATLAALVGGGTLPMLTAGQDLGTITLGLALAYVAWQRGRLGIGAAVLVAGAAIAKPHLALGLLAFMAGWRDRRILWGALVGGLSAVSVSVLAVGWTACIAFVETAIRSNGLPQANFVGFTGLFASWFGEGAGANVIAIVCGAGVLALAVALGVAVRRDRSRLGPALIAATLLSLLASPHTFVHDLTLLAPMMVVALAEAARRAGSGAWPARATQAVLALWLLLILAVAIDSDVILPPAVGRFTPLVLILAAAVACRAVWRARLPVAGPAPRVAAEPRATYVA